MDKKETIIVNGENVEVNNQKFKLVTNPNALGEDLARSNLADIYRKGWLYGIPVDHKKAFELYKACHLPYAFYRVGEYYETGHAGIVDIEQAKKNYCVAYKAGHGLARKKLQTFDFLH